MSGWSLSVTSSKTFALPTARVGFTAATNQPIPEDRDVVILDQTKDAHVANTALM